MAFKALAMNWSWTLSIHNMHWVDCGLTLTDWLTTDQRLYCSSSVHSPTSDFSKGSVRLPRRDHMPMRACVRGSAHWTASVPTYQLKKHRRAGQGPSFVWIVSLFMESVDSFVGVIDQRRAIDVRAKVVVVLVQWQNCPWLHATRTMTFITIIRTALSLYSDYSWIPS